jgi:glucose/mannose transport system permease protein
VRAGSTFVFLFNQFPVRDARSPEGSMDDVYSSSGTQGQQAASAAQTLRSFASRHMSKLVVGPTVLALALVVYGFILWTFYISMTESRMVPVTDFAGLTPYVRLWAMPRWYTAITNMLIFGTLFIGFATMLGLFLAILIDQRIRAEGALRTIFLYPMALSYIVTGTAWKWIFNPGLGIEKFAHNMGFTSFTFDWIINRDMVIYTLVIAAVWQSAGFVMAMFLAGLRGVDGEIVKAASLDGASMPRIYFSIIIPSLSPVFLSAVIILTHISIKSYDLVVALTAGGPGTASDLPATFMVSMILQKNQLAVGAASAIMMLMMIISILVPYLYSELRTKRHG